MSFGWRHDLDTRIICVHERRAVILDSPRLQAQFVSLSERSAAADTEVVDGGLGDAPAVGKHERRAVMKAGGKAFWWTSCPYDRPDLMRGSKAPHSTRCANTVASRKPR